MCVFGGGVLRCLFRSHLLWVLSDLRVSLSPFLVTFNYTNELTLEKKTHLRMYTIWNAFRFRTRFQKHKVVRSGVSPYARK